jgi:BTB/POZ domain-containing protein
MSCISFHEFNNVNINLVQFSQVENLNNLSSQNFLKLLNVTLKQLKSCPSLSCERDFYDKIIHAARVWWDHADNIKDNNIQMKVHVLCAKLIQKGERCRRTEFQPIQLVLQCGVVNLNAEEFEALMMASPIIRTSFSHNDKETNSNSIKLPNIKMDILNQILLMINNPNAPIPNSMDILELFETANFLRIESIAKNIANLINSEIPNEKSLVTFLTVYNFYNQCNTLYSKEISSACLINLMINIAEVLKLGIESFEIPIELIKEKAPGLELYLQGNFEQAIEVFKGKYDSSKDDLYFCLLFKALAFTGKYEDAVALVKFSLEKDVNERDKHHFCGLLWDLEWTRDIPQEYVLASAKKCMST